MALTELPLPLKGINYSLPDDKFQGGYSPYMNNIRPFDTLERKIRLGSRPPLDKIFTERIGGNANYPIVWLDSITSID